MRILPLLLSACIAATAWAEETPVPKPSPTPLPTLREAVDALDESQIQKAIDALTTNYLSPETIDDASLKGSLLEGILVSVG
jgi:hypothetical protein